MKGPPSGQFVTTRCQGPVCLDSTCAWADDAARTVAPCNQCSQHLVRVRAMAVGEVSLKNLGTVLKKEISTGLLISAAIALAAWVRAWSLGGGPRSAWW